MLINSTALFATHIIGGEMSYRALGNDEYEITLKIFRDCYSGQAQFDDPTNVFIFNTSGELVATLPISFTGSDTIVNSVAIPCTGVLPGICVEEADFIDTVTLFPFSAGGYTMVYQRCCRSSNVSNILSPDQTGVSYVGVIPDSIFGENNSSPYYNNEPPSIMCLDEPFIFDGSATDLDGDSLAYKLCASYLGADPLNVYPNPALPPPYSNVSYVFPYSGTQPMSGNPELAIDTHTGLLTVTPNSLGIFAITVCTEEYRNGIFLDEHRRDFNINVVQCNNPIFALTYGVTNCTDFTVHFNNNSSGASSCFWDFGVPGSTTDTSTQYSPSFTYPDSGNYIVILTINPNDSCSDADTVVAHVYPSLMVDFTPLTGFANEIIQFNDVSITTYGTITARHWNLGDGTFVSGPNPLHIYPYPNYYQVSLIDSTDLGCTKTTTHLIHIVLPNGIESPVNNARDGKTLVYNVVGEFLPDVKASYLGNDEWKINGDCLSAGIYFVKVSTGKTFLIKKIMIEK